MPLSVRTFIFGVAAIARAELGPCDPVDPSNCMFPFPNDFWLRGEQGNKRIAFNYTSLPKDNTGKGINASAAGWQALDGFSPLQASMVYFEGLTDASILSLPRLWSIEESTRNSSLSVLLDSTSGKRVAHWCELDQSLDLKKNATKKFPSLLLWPAQRLEDSSNYVVAFTGLRDAAGALIEPSAAFKALRDKIPTRDPNVEERRAHFESIFAMLTAAGVKRQELQVAWDFTTGSIHSLTNRLVSARDDALKRLGPAGPEFRITKVQSNYSSDMDKLVEGTMMVPTYLNRVCRGWTDFCKDVRLVLDESGNPVFQKYVSYTWMALIPRSVTQEGAAAGTILQYGHGLFGDKQEITYGSEEKMRQDANANGWILFASDWIGLAEADEPGVADMLATDLSNFAMIPDKSTQGMLNALVLMRLAKTGLFHNKEFMYNGKSVIDPKKTAYMGNSQGGILGAVYMGVSTDVTRGVLGVTGSPYSLLLPRSKDFANLFDVLDLRYEDDRDRIFALGLMQMLWDRAEPSAYLHSITRDPLPNTPSHRVMAQYGLGDAQVTWLGAHTIGRSLQKGGAYMFQSNVREGNETLCGFNLTPDSQVLTNGSLIVGFDFGVPTVPFVSQPPSSTTDTHECPRAFSLARQMQVEFFTHGTISNVCKGPCIGVRSEVCG